MRVLSGVPIYGHSGMMNNHNHNFAYDLAKIWFAGPAIMIFEKESDVDWQFKFPSLFKAAG